VRGRYRRQKRLLFYAAVRALRILATALPRRAGRGLFARIGDVVWLVDRPARRRSLSHLEIAFGSRLPLADRRRIARRSFRETGRNVFDLLHALGDGAGAAAESVEVVGARHLDAALAAGRGVIALSGHVGNWELMGAALAARGYPVHVVARELFDSRSHHDLNAWRRRCGIRVLDRNGGLLPVVRALRSGALVGTLVDQDTGGPSVFAPFFGRPARTSRAPFVLARRVGAPLVPMWVARTAEGRHRVEIRPALEPSGHPDPETAIREDAARWNALLEEAIAANPDQWVWHHRRWKTPPPADPARFDPTGVESGPREARRRAARRSRETVGAR
jgi:KDO2-lipid IV(A) lauroyltransferase